MQPAGPFRIGNRVFVSGYGLATVEAYGNGRNAGRIKVRYDDGSFYHVRSESLSPVSSVILPTLTQEMLQAFGLGEHELQQVLEEHMRVEAAPRLSFSYQTGDRVSVHGYGLANVEALVREGQFSGRVKVRYDDGTSYHVWEDCLSPAPAGAMIGAGLSSPLQSSVTREMAAAMGIGTDEFRQLMEEHLRAEAELATAAGGEDRKTMSRVQTRRRAATTQLYSRVALHCCYGF